MLAGAYSKTYRALENQHIEHLKQLAQNEKSDSLTRTKKLSFETNKRRRAQAVKRKLEQQKEEKRRQNILTKRREQQRVATEKYQRSHLPSRPHSNRSSPSGRRGNVSPTRTLDETLHLVRGGSSTGLRRQNSGGSSSRMSPRQNYSEALNKPYFNKYSNYQRPNSPPERVNESPNRLHNKSLHNLTNSKSLFEQQLEQQQRKLFDQQQQAFHEFNDAIVREIASGSEQKILDVDEDSNLIRSESLSSVDSLEGSQDSLLMKYQNDSSHVDRRDESCSNTLVNNNENVIRTNTSGVLSHDTHQNVREISAQLGQPLYRPQSEVQNGQIDSFNVDQTCSYGAQQTGAKNMVNKQDFQSVYQNGTQNMKDRPKVQLRAWATPSPVDSSHVSKPNSMVTTQVTNSNPYTSRNTMTSVTTTTKYEQSKSNGVQQQYVQSNEWSDERSNIQNQYTSKSQYDKNKPYQNNQNGQDQSRLTKNMTDDVNSSATKNMEFLETVTNTIDKKDMAPTPKSTPPPSRVPRPISGTRKANTENYTTIPAPSYGTTNNSGASVIETNSVTEYMDMNHMTSTQPSPKQQVIINTTSEERPQVRQVTQVKFAANVVNGNVHMANYGRLQVFPEKPATGNKQNLGYTNGVYNQIDCTPSKTTKDDAEITHERARMNNSETNEIKGILKRRAKNGVLRRAGSTGSVNKGFDVKDSIELTRVQMKQTQQVPRKKSVRFADLNYSDDVTEDLEDEEEKLFTQRKTDVSMVASKPPRPVSAKVVSQTTKVESKVPRVASAGSRPLANSKHKSTIRPQAAAHIITHNASASALLGSHSNQSQKIEKISLVNSDLTPKVPVSSAYKSTVHSPSITEATVYSVPGMRMNYSMSSGGTPISRPEQVIVNYNGKENTLPTTSANIPSFHTDGAYADQNGHVYNENGLRIDRTPTDDEINFLWDKVRTCLNRTSTTAPSPTVPEPPKVQSTPTSENVSRQAAPVSHTYIDGTSLGQLNSTTRVAQGIQNQQNGTLPYGRKTNGENVGVYQRRLGLLQQRKQQNPNNINKTGAQQREIITYHGPVFSNMEPSQPVSSTYQPAQDRYRYSSASESMAAFLTAEQLTQQSITDSQIQMAMDEAQRKQQTMNAGKPNQKVPSALSLEEQRLLESLDRLNERLKITEFPGAIIQEQQPMSPQDHVPQAFAYGGAFKGHQPIISQRKANEVNRGGYRGGSSIRLQKKP